MALRAGAIQAQGLGNTQRASMVELREIGAALRSTVVKMRPEDVGRRATGAKAQGSRNQARASVVAPLGGSNPRRSALAQTRAFGFDLRAAVAQPNSIATNRRSATSTPNTPGFVQPYDPGFDHPLTANYVADGYWFNASEVGNVVAPVCVIATASPSLGVTPAAVHLVYGSGQDFDGENYVEYMARASAAYRLPAYTVRTAGSRALTFKYRGAVPRLLVTLGKTATGVFTGAPWPLTGSGANSVTTVGNVSDLFSSANWSAADWVQFSVDFGDAAGSNGWIDDVLSP